MVIKSLILFIIYLFNLLKVNKNLIIKCLNVSKKGNWNSILLNFF